LNWGNFAWRLIGIGWFVAISVVALTLGGLWLDKKLNTVPWFSLAGATLGTFVAMYGVFRLLAPGLKGDDKGSLKRK